MAAGHHGRRLDRERRPPAWNVSPAGLPLLPHVGRHHPHRANRGSHARLTGRRRSPTHGSRTASPDGRSRHRRQCYARRSQAIGCPRASDCPRPGSGNGRRTGTMVALWLGFAMEYLLPDTMPARCQRLLDAATLFGRIALRLAVRPPLEPDQRREWSAKPTR